MAFPYTTGLTLDFDAAIGVFKDAAKTIPCTANGDQVYTWADQSGNGNDIIQATAANRPLYQTNIINSLPVVSNFSAGVNSYLTASNALSLSAQAQTVMLVYQPRARSVQGIYYSQGTYAFYHNNSASLTSFDTGAHSVSSGTVAPSRDFQVLTIIYGSSSITIRQNGVFQTTISAAVASTLTAFQLGALSNAQCFNGNYAEVGVWNSALSGANLTNNENYLLSKYNIPFYFPTTTPVVVHEGDSLSYGVNVALNTYEFPENMFRQSATGSLPYNYKSFAVPGSQFTDLVNRASQVDLYYSASRQTNILFVWCGTNDLANGGQTPAAAYARCVSYCQARQAVGWKVIVRTMIPRAAYSDANRLTFNASIRAGWPTFANGLDDIGNDSYLGVTGIQSNTVIYGADQIHYTAAGYGDASMYGLAAVNRLLGSTGINSSAILGMI